MRIAQALGGRRTSLLHPAEAAADFGTVAFVSRDVTGLSTKHRLVRRRRRPFYDVLRQRAACAGCTCTRPARTARSTRLCTHAA